jgi:penicillin amidase
VKIAGLKNGRGGKDGAPPGRRTRRRSWRAFALGALGLLGLLLIAGGALVAGLAAGMHASLPALQGEVTAAGLNAAVEIARDRRGVPTLRGASRRDVAFATGFVHAQERFFEMDLLRRRPAGELAALLGSRALPADRDARPHLLRARAERVLRASPPDVRAVLEAYSAGVNAGLAALGSRPFEYLALRAAPQPWRPEDSVLVLLGMFQLLEDGNANGSAQVTLMHELLPGRLAEFLMPEGTDWDTPLTGALPPETPIPGPEVVDLRHGAAAAPAGTTAAAGLRMDGDPDDAPLPRAASNAWAVAANHSASGRAMLADELHLDLAVPNLWYQASLSWPDPAAGGWATVAGATLPGAPAVVVGSNGHVAWGVTNSVLTTSDRVRLELDPRDPRSYRTPAGPRRFEPHRELLRVRGGSAEALAFDWTIWGPVVGKDYRGRVQAARWVVDEEDGVDFSILRLEDARELRQALDIAHHSGSPALNLVVADAAGHIAWTILGRLPRRVGLAGRWAESWAEGDRGWRGLIPPEEIPQVVDPPDGRIWVTNSRPVGGGALASLGSNFLLGARSRQIRDDLMAVDPVTREDMRRIQLDDRALFLQRWHDLMLDLLTPQAIAGHPGRRELRQLVERWQGHAAVSSAGFRMVRTYRVLLAQEVFAPLIAPCRKAQPDLDYLESFPQFEAPLWRLVHDQPLHLLSPRYASWRDQLLAAADAVIDLYTQQGDRLAGHTWGERNTLAIRHPLSFPGAGRWLDMPPHQLPGADDMPRVQGPSYGPSLRLVVSPGAEQEGFFNMPGGQSGNPLSPHYRDANAAWERDDPSPFLPGPPAARLRLVPAAATSRRP